MSLKGRVTWYPVGAAATVQPVYTSFARRPYLIVSRQGLGTFIPVALVLCDDQWEHWFPVGLVPFPGTFILNQLSGAFVPGQYSGVFINKKRDEGISSLAKFSGYLFPTNFRGHS